MGRGKQRSRHTSELAQSRFLSARFDARDVHLKRRESERCLREKAMWEAHLEGCRCDGRRKVEDCSSTVVDKSAEDETVAISEGGIDNHDTGGKALVIAECGKSGKAVERTQLHH